MSPAASPKEQVQKFIDKAKELGCDEDEGVFEDKLREIAKPIRVPTDEGGISGGKCGPTVTDAS